MTESVTERLNAALVDRYRIERELGQGGMATVYLARDLRHDRRVALKVLRAELAAVIGAERFLSEIRTTANLQHPHILPLFDSGRTDGQTEGRSGGREIVYYVMPFVEGESLRDRITREKQLPIGDALSIATEVASALSYAHGQGVIHRDIKPENILLHGGHALVADFGIALAAATTGGGRMTETGMSLGTPTYMSPEQAMGERTLDARTDIYALGCVLYEMLTGEPPFTGPTAQAIVARVMTEEPRALTQQRKTIPLHVEDAVLTALEKLPADRFASASEFSAALGGGAEGRSVHRTSARRLPSASPPLRLSAWLGWAAAAGLGALAAWGWLRRPPAVAAPVVRFTIPLERRTPGAFVLSSDGSVLLYTDIGARGTPQLFIRRLDQEATTPVDGTDRAVAPFLSPDGSRIGFMLDARLRTIPAAGGAPTSLTALDNPGGGAWGEDGTIVYSTGGKLYRIADTGGEPTLLAAPDSASDRYLMPALSPDGRMVAFTIITTRMGSSTLGLLSLADRVVTRIPVQALRPAFVGDDLLTFVDDAGTLLTARLARNRRSILEPPAAVLQGISRLSGTPAPLVSVARNGTVVYRSGGDDPREVVFVDREGRARPVATPPGRFVHPRYSPDGRRLGLNSTVFGARGDLWTMDLATARFNRVTRDGFAAHPVWTPDGRHLLYSTQGGSQSGLARVAADGSGEPEVMLSWPRSIWEAEMTPDGRSIAFRDDNPVTARDIYLGATDNLKGATPLLGSALDERSIAISPDGEWFTFVSNASEIQQVFLRRLSPGSGRWLISTGAGFEPRWARNGREIFYRANDTLYSVPVVLGREPEIGKPTAIFGGAFETSVYQAFYDVAPDGREFVFTRRIGRGHEEYHVVLHWLGRGDRLRATGDRTP